LRIASRSNPRILDVDGRERPEGEHVRDDAARLDRQAHARESLLEPVADEILVLLHLPPLLLRPHELDAQHRAMRPRVGRHERRPDARGRAHVREQHPET